MLATNKVQVTDSNSTISHSTSKVCWWAAPEVPTWLHDTIAQVVDADRDDGALRVRRFDDVDAVVAAGRGGSAGVVEEVRYGVAI